MNYEDLVNLTVERRDGSVWTSRKVVRESRVASLVNAEGLIRLFAMAVPFHHAWGLSEWLSELKRSAGNC
jgi:hypothetical protein